MEVTVQNTSVKMSGKALSGVKGLTKKKDKKKKEKARKTKKVLDEATRAKITEKRQEANKIKNERWSQILVEVAKQKKLSDVQKEILAKCIQPNYVDKVPRKLKTAFRNFVLITFKFENKHTKAVDDLFGILKTAEGSTPISVRRQEKRVKQMLKNKKRKEEKRLQNGVKVEKMDHDANEDVDMEATVKTEPDDASENDSDEEGSGDEALQVKGRSKKNRKKIEKVKKNATHLTGKLLKNKKGKGFQNKKRRSK